MVRYQVSVEDSNRVYEDPKCNKNQILQPSIQTTTSKNQRVLPVPVEAGNLNVNNILDDLEFDLDLGEEEEPPKYNNTQSSIVLGNPNEVEMVF